VRFVSCIQRSTIKLLLLRSLLLSLSLSLGPDYFYYFASDTDGPAQSLDRVKSHRFRDANIILRLPMRAAIF